MNIFKEFTPDLERQFLEAMNGITFLRFVPSAKNVIKERLHFSSASDRALMKKHMEMEKLIKPLLRYKTKFPLDDKKNRTTADKLVYIIQNPSRKRPLRHLEEYQEKLEHLKDFYPQDLISVFDGKFGLDTVTGKPLGNHTFYKTFKNSSVFYSGVDIRRPIKLLSYAEEIEDQLVPQVLQREISGMSHVFKVSIDPAGRNKAIRLLCRLDDDQLPCVPPIIVDVPENYPLYPPECLLMQDEYSTTPFLTAVLHIMNGILSNMPKDYSLSQLLNAWQVSVRKACFSGRRSRCYTLEMIFGL